MRPRARLRRWRLLALQRLSAPQLGHMLGLHCFRLTTALDPQAPCDLQRIDSQSLPECWFVAGLVKLVMVSATERDSVFVADLAPERSWPGEAQMMRICGERPYTRQGYEETNFRWSFAQTDGLAAIRPRPVSGPVRRDSWVVMTARIRFLGGFRR